MHCYVEPVSHPLPPLPSPPLHPLSSQEGLPAPVEACCQFLCNFARISAENQRALFDHIGPLLANLDENPGEPAHFCDHTHSTSCCSCTTIGLMTSDGYTPLDVATATIKNNHVLALALEEAHLEHVVSLLVSTTTVNLGAGSTEASEDNLGVLSMGSMCYEWAPNGGEKCLEFLQSAVWVDSECLHL